MNELKISRTRTTPEVELDPEGFIRIKGRSISENAPAFYKPVSDWIDEYVKTPARVTTVDLSLEYFNSSSAKLFVNMLQKITYVSLKNKRFVFNWYYEDGDDDIIERGQFFSTVLNVKFNFLKIA